MRKWLFSIFYIKFFNKSNSLRESSSNIINKIRSYSTLSLSYLYWLYCKAKCTHFSITVYHKAKKRNSTRPAEMKAFHARKKKVKKSKSRRPCQDKNICIHISDTYYFSMKGIFVNIYKNWLYKTGSLWTGTFTGLHIFPWIAWFVFYHTYFALTCAQFNSHVCHMSNLYVTNHTTHCQDNNKFILESFTFPWPFSWMLYNIFILPEKCIV